MSMSERPWEQQARHLTRAEKHALAVGVRFDEESHSYWKGERRLLNVTSILKHANLTDFSHIDPIYMDRGAAAHSAIHYALDHDLDRADLAEKSEAGATDLMPYVRAAERFLIETDIELVAVESVVIDEDTGFAGKLDCLGWLRRPRVLAMVDWKLGELHRVYGVQLAAYGLGWWKMARETVSRRYCVRLRPDGSYVAKLYDDRRDADRFRSALSVVQTQLDFGTLKMEDW